jgi:capsular exopolysaccharide synthesis family protein
MSRIFDALRKSEKVFDEQSFVSADTFLDTMEKTQGGGFDKIPRVQAHLRPQNRIVVATDSHSLGAERFRFLRARLSHWAGPRRLKTLLITSALPQDGKSTTVVNLAAALAAQGRKVLLLECDLRRPSIRTLLGLTAEPGLIHCLEHGSDVFSYIRRIDPLGFFLLPAGAVTPNPVELLQSQRFGELVQCLASQFDWVLIDSPPVSPMADAPVLKTYVDGCLLVVRAGVTPRAAVEEALELLGAEQVIGMILNGADGIGGSYYQYYYHYGSRDASNRSSRFGLRAALKKLMGDGRRRG